MNKIIIIHATHGTSGVSNLLHNNFYSGANLRSQEKLITVHYKGV